MKRTVSFISLLLLGLGSYASKANAQAPGNFIATGDMTTARVQHTSTLLADGKVLVAGGTDFTQTTLATAETYDPATGAFTRTGDMTTARRVHTATLLPNGMVLLAGGYGPSRNLLASAELYDPSSGIFTATGDLITAQIGHTASLLTNGKVLITGGGRVHHGQRQPAPSSTTRPPGHSLPPEVIST